MLSQLSGRGGVDINVVTATLLGAIIVGMAGAILALLRFMTINWCGVIIIFKHGRLDNVYSIDHE